MRINNNIMAMNTHRQYAVNNDNMAKATEKLSSGLRINRAGDDAAGLAISEKMRSQIRGLNMASKNSQDAISLVQTAEGALTETHSILQRMSELATQSASDTNQDTVDREALQSEFTALRSEIDDIANKTSFNGKKLLDGTFGSTASVDAGSEIEIGSHGITNISFEGFDAGAAQTITFAQAGGAGSTYEATFGTTTITGVTNSAGAHTLSLDFGSGQKVTIDFASSTAVDEFTGAANDTLTFSVSAGTAKIQTGASEGDTTTMSITSMKSTAIGTGVGAQLSDAAIDTQAHASSAITIVKDAINDVSTQRANLGAIQNRLEHKINNLNTSSENLSAAESRIRDVDMAAEMTKYTQTSILVQAATSMLAQANSAPQNVLSLLR